MPLARTRALTADSSCATGTAALGIAVLFCGLLWLAFYLARRVDARYEKRAALVARADEQHALVLAGDDRGIYGDYPPAA
jgi:hypothetical protein